MKHLVEWCGGGPLHCAHCSEPAVAMYIESGPWVPTTITNNPSQMSAAALDAGAVEEEIVADRPLQELLQSVPGFPSRDGFPDDDFRTGWKQWTFLCLEHAQQETRERIRVDGRDRRESGDEVSTTTTRMPLARAQALAEALVKDLEPGCTRIEIAGSIRRRKPDVGDIEIVCIRADRTPLVVGQPADLLVPILKRLQADGLLTWIGGRDRYTQFDLPHSHCRLDLFSVTKETWGCQLAIRTGPAEYSKRLVTKRCLGGLCPDELEFRGGRIWTRDGRALDTPDEDSVFRVLGLKFVQPWER